MFVYMYIRIYTHTNVAYSCNALRAARGDETYDGVFVRAHV